MGGTLSSIYSAQRSLSLNQAAIDLINSNIANMNTKGYSKQRLEISQLTSGDISTNPQQEVYDMLGAVISDISRNRDIYLDNLYRSENSQLNYYKELSTNSDLIEDITSELDGVGINQSLAEFYDALNQLALGPEDIVTRNNVVQKALELTTNLNSTYERLNDLRVSLVGDYTNPSSIEISKLNTAIEDLNNKLSSVADLNDAIVISSSQGNAPNYLLDQRDILIDEISSLIPVEVTYHENGSATLSISNINLVSGAELAGTFEVVAGDINNPSIVEIKNDAGGTTVSDAYSLLDSGQIGAILKMGGSDANELTVKSVIDNLDTIAQELASALNSIQTFDPASPPVNPDNEPRYIIDGRLSDFANGDPEPPSFFVDDSGNTTGITAGNITISQDIIDDPYKIAAASSPPESAPPVVPSDAPDLTETGDGSNALLMSKVRDILISGLGNSTTEQFIANIAGEIGSKASSIKNNLDIKSSVFQQVDLKRQSITGVNLDEEITDLIRFQQSYEAAARIFDVVNQNIKTIINMVS